MSDINYLDLIKKYPNLYKYVGCICCGPGWYDLIAELSTKLEAILEKEEEKETMYAVQVKEKYGTLRFYMSLATDEMWKLIEEAEHKSATICERCGKEGKIRPLGWVMTLCDQCFESRYDKID